MSFFLLNFSRLNIIILIAIIVPIIVIPFLIQRIKLRKEEKALEDQDKKLEAMVKKQNDKYDDFTDGHLYQ